MNNEKLNNLFSAARKEAAPAPPADFDASIMRAARHEAPAPREGVSVSDQLNRLFPKIAWAAIFIICFCIAGEIVSSLNSPGLGAGMAELSDQWTFTEKGF